MGRRRLVMAPYPKYEYLAFHFLKKGAVVVFTLLHYSKGQLISEAIFLVLNSSKTRTKYLKNFALLWQKFFVRFLEELRAR